MLVSFNNVSFSFGANQILKSASFIIRENSKVALIGKNGSGKTTIVNLLKGIYSPDNGEIIKKRDIQIGFLDQYIPDKYLNLSLIDFIKLDFTYIFELEQKISNLINKMSKINETNNNQEYTKLSNEYINLVHEFEKYDGYSLNARINSVINGLGFSKNDINKPIAQFSGGMQTKAQLCKLLLKNYDLIILDEPTNYLDTTALEFLESHLKNLKSSALVISHDRYFIDEIADYVLYLYNYQIEEFKGNYTKFKEDFEIRQAHRQKEYEKQQELIKETEEFYLKYRAGIKSKMARGRKKIIDRMEKLENPNINEQNLKLNFDVNSSLKSGEIVIKAINLTKKFGDKLLFENTNFEIIRGEKVGIIGNNGTGKTTLLKIILGLEPLTSGEIKIGHNVIFGYQDQLLNGLDNNNKVIDEIWNLNKLAIESEIRKYLAKFLFFKDDVFKLVKSLSGGEKSRLIMAKIIQSKANTLLLDEPTNHLDISSKEALENALLEFNGTVIFISHDRYFIDSIADKLLVIENNKINIYYGNYSYYREKIKNNFNINQSDEKYSNDFQTHQSNVNINSKPKLSKNTERIIKEEMNKIENEISLKENEISNIEKIFETNTINNKPLSYLEIEDLNNKYSKLKNEIDQLYEKLESLENKLKFNI